MKLKGTYCLIIYKNKKETIKIGALGKIEFQKGYYIYIGSAMNSLIPRLKRHLSDDKKLHWHIDYLLKKSKIIELFYTTSTRKIECKLAEHINKNQTGVIDFGCSDCQCQSHLVYYTNKISAIESVENAYTDLNISYFNLDDFNKLIN